MKIKTALSLSAAALIAATGIIAAITSLATRQADRIAAQGSRAETFIKEVFELSALTQSYLERREERPRAQWYAQYALLERSVNDPVFGDEPGRTFIPGLRSELDGIKATFDGLTARNEAGAQDPAAERLVAGDLLVKTQRLISGADELAKKAFAERAAARSRTDRMIFGLLGILAIAAVAAALFLYRRIVRPIERLQRGVEVVGKGDLGHKVGIAAQDEIGSLSRAFDDMTSKLRTSYETLEDKVRERTKQLEEANEKNASLLKSIGDGVVAIDLSWNIIEWNPAATKITGWAKEEAMGRPFRDVVKFFREHDRSENFLFISDAMLSNEVRFMGSHTLLARKDGTEIPVGDSAAPIVGEDGKVRGAIITFRDMTDERAAQLIRSSYAYAHHQLRTPVTVASWSIQAALDEADPSASRKMMSDASRAMQSVRKLTEELVEVSEIDNAMVAPKIGPTPVATLFEEAVALIRDKAEARKIKLMVDSPPATITVPVDRRLLLRVLHEVLDNAVEYGSTGGKVRVQAMASHDEVRFDIVDDGIGIPAAQQGIIFTKFFRGQNIPEGSVGAGLGLYISKEYLKLFGGKIWFDSKEKKGSTFYITVPL